MTTGSLETDRVPATTAAGARHTPSWRDRLRGGEYRAFAAALLVFVGYYAGVKLGFALTFEPHPISVLWPPNAILLGALLVTPLRWWGGLLAAALAAHLIAQFEAHVPAAMVFCWFISNAAEALIGAFCVRRYLQRPVAFDSIRNVAVFLFFAVFLAPFLSSFLDAGFVTLIGWGQSTYWELWETRFLSNVLTTLTVVPAVVALAGDWRASFPAPRLRRVVEAVVLLASLAAACVGVFNAEQAGSGATPAFLYLPLPFLLWAALRFGSAGASLCFMIVALTAVWGAGHGQGPFSGSDPIENASAVQMFLTVVAITLLTLVAEVQERDASERRLRRSEDRFATAFRLGPDAMVISRKADGRIIDVNERWAEMFGFPPGEVVGRTVRELNVFATEGDLARLLAVAEETGSIRDLDLRFRTRKGDLLQAVITAETVEMAGDACFVTIVRDVTEQRRVEQESREQRQQLTHLTRVATLGELSGALAHELNQPLTAILSNAQAAQRFLARDPVDLGEIRAILGDIVEADKRAGEVIRRLRALLKKGESQFVPLDLGEILGEVLAVAHGDFVTRNVDLAVRFNSGLPPVRGDRVQIQQLLLNLMANACESMTASGRSPRELTISTSYEWDGTVRVAVSDTGGGIPPDRLERLFEPFYTTKEQGLGLGLAICRTIASAHGGRLWAANNARGGATFSLSLPALGAASLAAGPNAGAGA